MITHYGHPYSRAHRVLWMLKKLAMPLELVPTPFQDGSTGCPEFIAINPNGACPGAAMRLPGPIRVLTINLVLARSFVSELSPGSLEKEGLATQWSFWAATDVEKPLLFAAANLVLFAPEARIADELAVMHNKLDRPFQVLDQALAARAWLLGDRFNMADLNVAAVLTLGVIAGVPTAAYPNLSEWLDRCIERPAAAVRMTMPRQPGPVQAITLGGRAGHACVCAGFPQEDRLAASPGLAFQSNSICRIPRSARWDKVAG